MLTIKNNLNSLLSQIESGTSINSLHKRSGRVKMPLRKWLELEYVYPGSDEEFIARTANLSNVDKRILSMLIDFSARGLRPFMTQKYIGDKNGYSREYINRRIRYLREEGFLESYTRGNQVKQQSCVYRVAQQFFRKDLWESIKHISAINRLMLGFLLVASVMNPIPSLDGNALKSHLITLLQKNKYINNNISKEDTDTRVYTHYEHIPKKRDLSMKKDTFPKNGSIARQISYIESQESMQERIHLAQELKSKRAELYRYRETMQNSARIASQMSKAVTFDEMMQHDTDKAEIVRDNLRKLGIYK